MNKSWSNEVWRLFGLVFLGLIFGGLIGQVAWALVLLIGAYLVWHLRNLYRLDQWLQGKRKGIPEYSEGAWSNVYYHLYRLQQRNRRRKKRLATMVSRFRESTNALPDAAVILDAAGNIETWNKKAKELLKLKAPQDVGQPVTNLLRNPIFNQYLMQQDFGKALQLASPFDEKVHLSLRLVPYGNKQQLLQVRNITHLHNLEVMRRDFIANVSHELRTPLTVISGYLETMMDDNDEWALKNNTILTSMSQQATRMQNIVTDLLLLSRLETESSEHVRQFVDVPAMLEMIRNDAEAFSQGRHKITLEYDKELCLHGNREELVSAFSNLIFNAVKYTQNGGEIHVRWYANSKGAHFEVQDNGAGIPAQHVSRLTERFYRVDVGRSRASGGTGLGLAIVKHVLNRHGAKLQIVTELDKGSTFSCHFPQKLVMSRAVA